MSPKCSYQSYALWLEVGEAALLKGIGLVWEDGYVDFAGPECVYSQIRTRLYRSSVLHLLENKLHEIGMFHLRSRELCSRWSIFYCDPPFSRNLCAPCFVYVFQKEPGNSLGSIKFGPFEVVKLYVVSEDNTLSLQDKEGRMAQGISCALGCGHEYHDIWWEGLGCPSVPLYWYCSPSLALWEPGYTYTGGWGVID